MKLSARERESRSKRRQSLNKELAVWLQREKDPDAILDPKKAYFARQEQAKLQRELKMLDFGFRKQRAWSQGKLLY